MHVYIIYAYICTLFTLFLGFTYTWLERSTFLSSTHFWTFFFLLVPLCTLYVYRYIRILHDMCVFLFFVYTFVYYWLGPCTSFFGLHNLPLHIGAALFGFYIICSPLHTSYVYIYIFMYMYLYILVRAVYFIACTRLRTPALSVHLHVTITLGTVGFTGYSYVWHVHCVHLCLSTIYICILMYYRYCYHPLG